MASLRLWLTSVAGFLPMCPVIAPAQSTQRRTVDWVVQGSETIRGGRIVMAASLIVPERASLTLQDVTLAFEQPAQGPLFRIEARPGSSLTIENSTLAPAAAGARYRFVVDGAQLALRNSRLEGVTREDPLRWQGGLLIFRAAGTVMENNIFPVTDAPPFVLVECTGARIQGNTFQRTEVANSPTAELNRTSGSIISNNRFLHTGLSLFTSHNNRITGNELGMPSSGVFLYAGSGYNLVAFNRAGIVDGLPTDCFAFRVVSCHHPNWIVNNTAAGLRYTALISYSSGTVFAGNTISGMTDPHTGNVQVHHSEDIQVLNNEIRESVNGILLFGVRKSVVRGNLVDGAWYGVSLHHSHGNTIAENEFARNLDNAVLIDSRDNTLERNNLLQRRRQAWVEGSNRFRNNYFHDAPAAAPYPLPPAGNADPAPSAAPYPRAPAPVPEHAAGNPEPRARESITGIGSTVAWENCERTLDGGISVTRGGRLTIRNCRIVPSLNHDDVDGSGIGVFDGGTLEILDSVIAGDGLRRPYRITQFPGGTLTIRNSRILNASTWASGIDLQGEGAVIENSEITGGYFGFRINSGGRYQILNNRVSRSHQGIFIASETSGGGLIRGNTFTDCLIDGIVGEMRQGRVLNNRVERSHNGISVGGDGTVVQGNVLVDNVLGLAGGGPRVQANSFYHNGRVPFWGWPAGQASSPSGEALGQYRRGNYFEDYLGPDNDGDGVGDIPYEPAPDLHPLMRPPSADCGTLRVEPELWFGPDSSGVTVPVSTAGACTFAAASDAAWLRAAVQQGQLALDVAANSSSAWRTAALTVGPQSVRVYQAPAGCRYELDPARIDLPAAGGSAVVQISSAAGCGWTVVPQSAWLSVAPGSPAGGVGSGQFTAVATFNPGPARRAWVTVGGVKVQVTQGAGGPFLVPKGIVNAASFQNTVGLSPNTLVSLFGLRLGPDPPAIAARPEIRLGGILISIQAQPAFSTFAGGGQVNFLIPSQVRPATLQPVYVERAGFPPVSTPLAIATASPGIFTANGSGAGPAVAVNQDGSFNSAANPAAPGSLVTFFATGYGMTDPALPDGQHPQPPEYPRPVLPLSVSIGGRPVSPGDVVFAGVIYAGILQVNCRIPASSPVGDLELELSFACPRGETCRSQPAVTIAVR